VQSKNKAWLLERRSKLKQANGKLDAQIKLGLL
jgi:hypothetical protein